MKAYRNQRGQLVGQLNEGVFRKVVSSEVHLFKNQDGWGIDREILNDLPEKTEVRILDKDTKTVYYSDVETFKTGTLLDWGHSPQYILWKGLFDTQKDGVRVLSTYKECWAKQMELWNSI